MLTPPSPLEKIFYHCLKIAFCLCGLIVSLKSQYIKLLKVYHPWSSFFGAKCIAMAHFCVSQPLIQIILVLDFDICFDNINGCVKSVSNCQSLNKLSRCANRAQRFNQFGTLGNKSSGSNNMIYEFEGKRPTIDPSAYISDSAVVIGDVTIGARCYIGPGQSYARMNARFG